MFEEKLFLSLAEVAQARGLEKPRIGMRVGVHCSVADKPTQLNQKDIAVVTGFTHKSFRGVPLATLAFHHAPWDGVSSPHEIIKIPINKPLAF